MINIRKVRWFVVVSTLSVAIILGALIAANSYNNSVADERQRLGDECNMAALATLELHKQDWQAASKSSVFEFGTYNPHSRKCFVMILSDVRDEDKIVPTKKIYNFTDGKLVLECTWVPGNEELEFCLEAETGQRTTSREDAILLQAKYLYSEKF